MMGLAGLGVAGAAAGTAYLWVDEAHMAERPSLWVPIAYGFALGLLNPVGTLAGETFWGKPFNLHLIWAGPAAAGGVFLWTAMKLRDRAGVVPASRAGLITLVATMLIALFGLAAPGIGGAGLVVRPAFPLGRRGL